MKISLLLSSPATLIDFLVIVRRVEAGEEEKNCCEAGPRPDVEICQKV